MARPWAGLQLGLDCGLLALMDGSSDRANFNKAQPPPRRSGDERKLDRPFSARELLSPPKPRPDPDKVLWLKRAIIIGGVLFAILCGAGLLILANLASNLPAIDNPAMDEAAGISR